MNKVLYIGDYSSLNNHAQVNRMLDVVSALDGIEVYILTNKFRTIWNNIIVTKGVVNYVKVIIRIVCDVVKNRYDIVLFYNPYYHILPFLLLPKKLRKKCVLQIEDTVPSISRSMEYKIGLKRLLRFSFYEVMLKFAIYRFENFIISSPNFERASMKNVYKLYGCKELRAVPKQSDKTIFIGGRLDIEYGLENFLEAIKIFFENASDWSLIICGDGSQDKLIDKVLGIYVDSNRVRKCYNVSREAYIQLLRNSGVCISIQPNSGLYKNCKTPSKVYEYLSLGKKTIAFDYPSFEDLKDSNLLFIIDDFDELGNKIIDLYERDFNYEGLNSMNVELISKRLKLWLTGL